MTALLVAAVLVSGIVTFASPTAAKRKHVYAYSSLTYGYRIGSPRWWRAMDRAGRGGRPGGIWSPPGWPWPLKGTRGPWPPMKVTCRTLAVAEATRARQAAGWRSISLVAMGLPAPPKKAAGA